jgi:sulfite reductase alpha subunit-like flavoprotein
LSYFTDNELEKEKLQEFTTPEGQEELYNYCNRPRRTILEVLTDFPHATANLTLEYLFEIFSPIRPRAFSIASAPSVCLYLFTYRNNISILVKHQIISHFINNQIFYCLTCIIGTH